MTTCCVKPYPECQYGCSRKRGHPYPHRIPTLEWGWVEWIIRGTQPDVRYTLRYHTSPGRVQR